MNDITKEINLASPDIIEAIKAAEHPPSLSQILTMLPNHREDAVRMAFWSLVALDKIELNNSFRASIPHKHYF